MSIALRSGVAVIPMAGGIQLRIGDDEVHVVRTDAPEVVLRVLEAIDGRRDRARLLAELGEELAEVVDSLLRELERAGLLREGDAGDLAAMLAATRVGVVGHAPGSDRLVDLLAEHGITAQAERSVEDLAGSCHLVVGLVERPDLALLFAINAAATARAVPALFVDASHGRHATVGPFFVPGESACFRCARARLHENTAAFEELLAAERLMVERGAALAGVPLAPAHRQLVLGIAAAEVVAFVTRDRPLRTLDRAITVSFDELRTWSEPVWRVPWCAACGGAVPT